MKISIVGNDTLAAATVECCRRHFTITTPSEASIVWVAYDTPIRADDKPDTEWVLSRIREDLKTTAENALVLISSQLPVGTTAKLEGEFPARSFAHSPENIRVATAVADFENQSRIVVGVRTDHHNAMLRELLTPFTKNLIFTNTETAEMCKHSLNCLLGVTIAFINEIAKICAAVGANVDVVTMALRTDPRYSAKTPLKAGPAFGGGHLARDIFTVTEIAKNLGIEIPIISHIKESNDHH